MAAPTSSAGAILRAGRHRARRRRLPRHRPRRGRLLARRPLHRRARALGKLHARVQRGDARLLRQRARLRRARALSVPDDRPVIYGPLARRRARLRRRRQHADRRRRPRARNRLRRGRLDRVGAARVRRGRAAFARMAHFLRARGRVGPGAARGDGRQRPRRHRLPLGLAAAAAVRGLLRHRSARAAPRRRRGARALQPLRGRVRAVLRCEACVLALPARQRAGRPRQLHRRGRADRAGARRPRAAQPAELRG